MFKIPSLPSPHADINELADYVEWLCWRSGSSSIREINAAIGREGDNENNIGCDDEESRTLDKLDDVMMIIDRRKRSCRDSYPFLLEHNGTVIKLLNNAYESERAVVYLYLLLCTRLNMAKDRIHAGIDGAALFEELSIDVLKSYLKVDSNCTYLFGTSVGGRFEDKINELCAKLGEGGGFRGAIGRAMRVNDDKLDSVAWIPFYDNRPGKVILFCQCKTGTNWRDELAVMRPDAFIKLWFSNSLYVDPLRVFFLSESLNQYQWERDVAYGGILFDRCRIVGMCTGINLSTYDNIKNWTLSALEKHR